jgi:RNA polymerase sigma-70 factor (ECF subfamily)
MGSGPPSSRAAQQRLIEQLFQEVRGTVPGLDVEGFAQALWRSVEKAGVAGGDVPAYLRGLRLPDLALAAACVSGSETAWAQLLAKTREPLRAAGRAMAGDRGEELADSLFGELYAARQTKLLSYAGRSSLTGWLRAVLYQAYVDRFRSERRLVQMDPDGPEPPAPPAPDPVEQGESRAIAARALERALAALPPRQKLLLDFYYFHGLTLREAAALVKVHEATASRELDRARAALRTSLTEILRREHRLNDEEVRRCLLEAVESGLEVRKDWSARSAAPERS